MLKTIIDYLNNTTEKDLDFYEFVTKLKKETVFNTECFLSFFNRRNYTEKEKFHILVDILNVKSYVDLNRIHTKGRKLSPFFIYSNNYHGPLKKEDFDELYISIDEIKLYDYEDGFNKKSVEAFKYFVENNEPANDILMFLSVYYREGNKYKIESFKKVNKESLNDYYAVATTYSHIANLIKPEPIVLFEMACLCDDMDASYLINDTYIYQKFFYSIDDKSFNDIPIFVINPSLTFIRKFIKSNPLKNREVFFLIKDQLIVKLLNSLFRIDYISFDSINNIDKLLITKESPSDVLFFAEGIPEKGKILESLLSHSINEQQISIVDVDSNIFNNGSIIKKIVKGCNVKAITLLPSVAYEERKSPRKVIVDFKNDAVNNKTINVCGISISKSKSPSFIRQIINLELDKENFFEKTIDVRSLYREHVLSANKKSNKARNTPNTFRLTRDIDVKYTASFSSGYHRINTFFVNPFTQKRIKASLGSGKLKELDNLNDWIKYKYISNIDGSIIEEIRRIYKDFLINYDISLDTFIFLENESYKTVPENFIFLIKEINSSFLAEISLKDVTSSDIKSFVESLNHKNITERQVLNVLYSLFVYAVNNGYLHQNPCDELMNKYERDKGIYAVSSALTKKFFYEDELKKIIKHSVKKYEDGTDLYLIFLIRLITGLEPNIICGLSWNKLTRNEINGIVFYNLVVNIELNNRGDKFKHFDSRNQYIRFPLPSFLSKILIERKNSILKNHPEYNEEYLNNCAIISGPDYVLNGQFEVYSPYKAYRCIRKILKNNYSIDESIIYVPNKDGNFTEVNIAYYQGDLFRTNFEHLATVNSYLNTDEINHLLRRKSGNVFSNHYCDYENNYSQFKLFLAIEKMWGDYYE